MRHPHSSNNLGFTHATLLCGTTFDIHFEVPFGCGSSIKITPVEYQVPFIRILPLKFAHFDNFILVKFLGNFILVM